MQQSPPARRKREDTVEPVRGGTPMRWCGAGRLLVGTPRTTAHLSGTASYFWGARSGPREENFS